MSDQLYYQYAFALPDCSVREIGPGVDPRFPVELVCNGPVAAVVSRVGWDESDLKKLQAQSAEDLGWLKRVAVRHHEIVCQAAASSPVLPLRLGTLFRSQASLLAAMLRCQAPVADFLHTLAGRQEWAVRLYLSGSGSCPETTSHFRTIAPPGRTGAEASVFQGPRPPGRGYGQTQQRELVPGQAPSLGEEIAEKGVAGGRSAGVERSSPPDPRHSAGSLILDPGHPPPPPHHRPTAGAGTAYLKQRQAQLRRRRELQAALPEEIQAVEDVLKARAERCCRVRTWPAGFTGRREKMVFHAAYLLPSSEAKAWLATVDQTRHSVRRKGLLLEVTGPWPPYHFCPPQSLTADY